MNEKNKASAGIFAIVLFQIAIMVASTASESYIISGNETPLFASAIGNFLKNSFSAGINLLAGFLTIKQIGTVSADGITCCEKKTGGGWCFETGDSGNCNLSLSPVSVNGNNHYSSNPSLCSQASFCALGTCIISNGLSCMDSIPERSCKEQNGQWDTRDSSQIQVCLRGACVFPDHATFVTREKCKVDSASANPPVTMDFRPEFNTQEKTTRLSNTIQNRNNYGACVSNSACRFVTGLQCENDNGNFFPTYLCTNPALQTLGVNCQPTARAECLSGRDEVYFVDSCGNPGNIYDKSKAPSSSGQLPDANYWSVIVSKIDSCPLSSGNKNSCGNCARISASGMSTACSQTKAGQASIENSGGYVCKDLNCTYTDYKTRTQTRYKNGESWCQYMGTIGNQTDSRGDAFSADTVGSEQIKLSCVDGEVRADPIKGSGRANVCVPRVLREPTGSNTPPLTFSTASIEQNLAPTCLSYNPLMNSDGKIEEAVTSCEDNPHCYIKEVSVDQFKFIMCVPRYTEQNDAACSLASLSCPVVYVKGLDGKWSAEENENCEKPEFAQDMNNLCISLGDCGNYVNFIGNGTNNIQITKSKGSRSGNYNKRVPSIEHTNWERYASFATNLPPNQAAVSGIKTEQGANGSVFLENFRFNAGGIDFNVNLANALGAAGLATWLGTGIFGSLGFAGIGITNSPSVFTPSYLIGGGSASPTTLAAASWSSYAAVGTAAIVGAAVGNYVARQYGVSGDAADALVITGAIGAGTTAYLLIASELSALSATGYGIGIAAVIMAAIVLSGAGQSETRNINFVCMPWKPPRGGNYCGECNKNPVIPCTPYMCKSLGRLCNLINQNTDNPICITNSSSDVTPPILDLKEIDTSTYNVTGNLITDRQINILDKTSTNANKCVKELGKIPIVLQTDEIARCKFSSSAADLSGDFDSNAGTMIGTDSWKNEQNFSIDVPSLSELDPSGKLASSGATAYVVCEDYYGNLNLNPYKINFCVYSGPDLTPPGINLFEPATNSYASYGTTSKNISIWLNEEGSCRYNPTPGISYAQMPNSIGFECSTKGTVGAIGHLCEGMNLTGIKNGTNDFYIRCSDSSGNAQAQDYQYTIIGTQTRLKINSISLSSVIAGRTVTLNSGGELSVGSGATNAAITLRASTSGGVGSGAAECFYQEPTLVPNSVEFLSDLTNPSSTHTQSLNPPAGNYNLSIQCSDTAGNADSDYMQFDLNVDSTPPAVVRAYNGGGKVTLLTSEDARCFYSFDADKKCGFTTEEGISMSVSGYSTIQTANIAEGKTYYIKCEDIFGNRQDPMECAIQINPGFWQD